MSPMKRLGPLVYREFQTVNDSVEDADSSSTSRNYIVILSEYAQGILVSLVERRALIFRGYGGFRILPNTKSVKEHSNGH